MTPVPESPSVRNSFPGVGSGGGPKPDLAAFGLPAPDRIRNVEVVPLDPGSDEAKRLSDGLSMIPERLLQMTVEEGSWMSVDVSPDGSLLVFDLLGSLWTLPIGGGEATPLTRGMAFDAQPRFSPDGKRIVFTSDRSGGENLWIVSLDGADMLQLTRGNHNAYQSPVWTPDGRYVVATRQGESGQGKLWMYHIDGGTGTALIFGRANLRTTGACFTPDGNTLWFARRIGAWTDNTRLGDPQLALWYRESGETRTASNRWGGAFRPTVSPDGRWLVYGSRHLAHTGLRVRDLETEEERWLAYPVQRDQQESRATRDAYPGMAFTPDSRELVASWGGRLWRVPIEGGPAREIPFRAEVELPMGPAVHFDFPIDDEPTFVARQVRDAVPSPDGTRIAFSLLGRIYVRPLHGGEPERLTELPGNQHRPVWSPDGARLVFVNWDPDEGGHLWTVPSAGGSPLRLTRGPAYYQEPAWSPDGSRIVAIRGPARAYREALTRGVPFGSQEVVQLPATGGEASLVRRADGCLQPHFTGDPDRIFVYGREQGLISFRWDGTDEKTHLRVTGPPALGESGSPAASLILMSPTGEEALAEHEMQLYTVHVPRVGSGGVTVDLSNPEEAAFPVRRLTEIGGQFPAWSADGKRVHWSIGNMHRICDLSEPGPAEARVDGFEAHARSVRIEVRLARNRPRGTLLLRGARLITMREREVIEDGELLVRDHRIAGVGPRDSLDLPPGTEIRELDGHTIIPGFVDTHAHLRATSDVHREQPWSYAANLAYGVTTTRDPQSGETDILSYEDRVSTGRAIGPRIYSTGPGIFATERIQSLDDARRVLRRYSDYYCTKTIKMYGAGNRETRQNIMRAARELGLMPTAEGSLDLKLDLTMALDGYSGMEHNMPGFPLYGDVAHLVACSGMAYTPAVLVTYGAPWAENWFFATEDVIGDKKLRIFTPIEEIQRKALRRSTGWFHPDQHTFGLVGAFTRQVVEAGGCAGVGSHGQLQGLGFHWELWALREGGMAQHDALRVATLLGARAIGLGGDLGSLEPGKLADLVVLRRNPLDDIRHTNTVRWVMLDGRIREGDTLDEIWPRRRPAERFEWAAETPLPGVEAGIGKEVGDGG